MPRVFTRHLPDAAFSNGTLSLERARSLVVPKKLFCLFIIVWCFQSFIAQAGHAAPLSTHPGLLSMGCACLVSGVGASLAINAAHRSPMIWWHFVNSCSRSRT